MKYILLFGLFLLLPFAQAQKVKSLIEKGDLEGIKKMHDKGEDVFSYFELPYYHEYDEEEGWEFMFPMGYAVAKGQPEIVNFYIEHQSTSSELAWWNDALGQAFIIALSLKDETTAEQLYALNPDLDYLCISCRDHNALMVAVAYDLETWYFKLKENSNLSQTSSSGNTLLHIALTGTSHKVFDDVMESGLYDINQANSFSQTPLDFAAFSGNADFFHHLIEAGASLELAPMIWLSVAISGDMELYSYIEKNAPVINLYNSDDWGSFALDVALQENNEAVALAIIETTLNYAEVYGGSSGKRYDFIDNYLFMDPDVDPLLWTVYNNNAILFEACIRLAADVNAVMEDTYIPITKELTKAAKKVFGKDFVEEVYSKYGVVV